MVYRIFKMFLIKKIIQKSLTGLNFNETLKGARMIRSFEHLFSLRMLVQGSGQPLFFYSRPMAFRHPHLSYHFLIMTA